MLNTPKEITNKPIAQNGCTANLLAQDKENNSNKNKRKMTKTDQLLADLDEMYMTDDSTNESSFQHQKRRSLNDKENSNNILLGNIKPINLNECKDSHKKIAQTIEVDSNSESSELKVKQIEIDENETIIKHFGTINSNHKEQGNEIEEQEVKINDLNKNGFDQYEISKDICAIKLFSNKTYLAPYVNFTNSNEQTSFTPFFESLSNLELVSKQKNNMKCRVIAKINRFAIHSPQITNVYVYCKKCYYINFVPYHSAEIHQSEIIHKIIKEYNDKQNNSNNTNNIIMSSSTQTDTERDHIPLMTDQKDEGEMHAVNFSLDWFLNAKLSLN
jgi:hypothetical protein